MEIFFELVPFKLKFLTKQYEKFDLLMVLEACYDHLFDKNRLFFINFRGVRKVRVRTVPESIYTLLAWLNLICNNSIFKMVEFSHGILLHYPVLMIKIYIHSYFCVFLMIKIKLLYLLF